MSLYEGDSNVPQSGRSLYVAATRPFESDDDDAKFHDRLCAVIDYNSHLIFTMRLDMDAETSVLQKQIDELKEKLALLQ